MIAFITDSWVTAILQYREVQADEIPGVPAGEYERVRAELEPLGFHSCGGVEDVTISRAYPELRTYLEAFVHEAQTVYAASYYSRDPTGLARCIASSALGAGTKSRYAHQARRRRLVRGPAVIPLTPGART